MNDLQITEAQWLELQAQFASNVELEALYRFAEQLDAAKKSVFAAGRAALGEFDKHHKIANEQFEACEKYQARAEELHVKQNQVIDLLRKYLPTPEVA